MHSTQPFEIYQDNPKITGAHMKPSSNHKTFSKNLRIFTIIKPFQRPWWLLQSLNILKDLGDFCNHWTFSKRSAHCTITTTWKFTRTPQQLGTLVIFPHFSKHSEAEVHKLSFFVFHIQKWKWQHKWRSKSEVNQRL